MIGVTVELGKDEIKNISQALKGHAEAAERAIIRTRNDVVERGMPKLTKHISKTYNISRDDLTNGKQFSSEKSKNLIKAKKTNSIHQSPRIEARGSHLTLMRFVQENKPNKKGVVSKMVKVKVKKGRAKKMGKTTFINTDRNGNLQVFQRRSDSRKINKLLKTTSVAFMANNENVKPQMQDDIKVLLDKRSAHYIKQELKKIKGVK